MRGVQKFLGNYKFWKTYKVFKFFALKETYFLIPFSKNFLKYPCMALYNMYSEGRHICL